MKVNFDSYSYYPALRTRAAEILGLSNLAYDKKEKILPLITLGKWPRSDEIKVSLDKSLEAMNKLPFILDVTQENKHHCASSFDLLSSEKNFSNWISFCSNNENIIPVVQMPESARLRDIVQQARILEENKGSIAFRIKNLNTDINKTVASLVSLNSPENSIIFIDLGYIRGHVSTMTSAAISAINQIRTEIPEAIISVLSTSFPSSVANFAGENGQSGYIDIMEREFHQTIGGRGVSIYGDHGSIHSVVYDDVGGRYVPRIDVALDDAWFFERRPGLDSKGYIEAARAILKRYPNYLEEESWGAQMIKNAASGDIAGMGSPAKWISVRVNLHITKQIELSEALKTDYDPEEDFF
ncbi:protein beta [Salmonella enterica subsp. enterica serovar Mississippi]|nr:protein beta [Salmonella enterica subsp. enterica serovar Mississippi]